VPETPLLHYLRLQRGLDRDILSALRVSAASIESELRRLEGRAGIGAAARSYQLTQSQAYINREMARFWGQAGNTIAEHQANAAAEAAEASLRENQTLSRLFSKPDLDYMARSTRATAAQGLETAMQRVSGASYVPLAESVYQNTALTSGKVDDIVTSALARGASAAELARDVRGFINPNTPGGVRYASMRLGRTELNNAFHASQIQQAQKSPWVVAVQWHLSGSHPKPDECNEYAEGGDLKDGLWKPGSVPGKPHPQCLCYTTTVDVGRDEFIKQFDAGQYDEFISSEFPDLPSAAPAKTMMPPLKTSETSWDLHVLDGDYDRGREWQRLSNPRDRAEMLWSETYAGSNSIRQVLVNRLEGRSDLYGIDLEQREFKRYLARDWDTDELIYTLDDLGNELRAAADHIGRRMNNPQVVPKMFRGMHVDDPSIFQVGDVIPSDLSSWTSRQGVGEMYARINSDNQHPVLMVMRDGEGVGFDSDTVRDVYDKHDEHLVRGTLRISRIFRRDDYTVVEVDYAP
jgi:hypothetical protein